MRSSPNPLILHTSKRKEASMPSTGKKLLKVALIVIIVLIAVPLLVALFVPKDYTVIRMVTIHRPSDEVFAYVKYLKNQDNYSVWAAMDPTMKREFRGVDGTVGFVSAWDGNKEVGKGEQEIVGIMEGEQINYKLHFIEPFEGRADVCLSTEPVNAAETRVTWRFDSSMPYPINLLCLFMNMDEAIGTDLETGLSNLRGILEANDMQARQ
jgi:hypothetical protein